MPKTYRVHFIDARHNVPNVKLLEADCVGDVFDYMPELGYKILHISSETMDQKMQSLTEDYRRYIMVKLTELEVTGCARVHDTKEFQLLKELFDLDSEVCRSAYSLRMSTEYPNLCESYIVKGESTHA